MKRKKESSESENTHLGDFAIESPLEEVAKKMLGNGEGEEKLEIKKEALSVDDLKRRVEEKEKEYAEMYDRLLRTTADFENFKKRAEREKLDYIKFANEDLVRELLPIVDNLERALAASENSKNTEGIKRGIGIVLEQFHKILKKCGLTGFVSIGEKFDPTRHEAVEQVESTEHEADTIVEELQKGYFLNGRLIRPALVTVTRVPDEAISSD